MKQRKLRNKETGELGALSTSGGSMYVVLDENGVSLGGYDSLAKVCEEWEDYEETRDYWYIDTLTGGVCDYSYEVEAEDDGDRFNKRIGNYFETREEAERAVEKLKAWKRLKDKGFRFDFGVVTAEIPEKDGVQYAHRFVDIRATMPDREAALSSKDDLDLLFGGEE